MVELIIEEEMVSTGNGDIAVFLRNKRRPDCRLGVPARTVLFVHGATYPSTVTFDFQAGGYSWMDSLALAGFDCWLMDIRGYGRSDRPHEMSEAPEANGPIVHTNVAIADLALVIEHIIAERGLEKLQLIGYSWGTLITGAYTADNNDKVERLALYGTSMLNSGAGLIGNEPPVAAYRLVTQDAAKQRWEHGLSGEEIATIIEPEWQARWLTAAVASDPRSGDHEPPQLRAPTGVVDDKVRRWSKGRFQYDPAAIEVPTLIVIGERDVETPPEGGLNLYHKLSHAPHRQYSLIGMTSHSAFIERRRDQLFAVTQSFLQSEF